MLEPDICTSLLCKGCSDYCVQCSHAIFKGSSGKWSWEFIPRFGFEFLKKNGEPKAVQPGKNNPIWEIVSAWQKEKGL